MTLELIISFVAGFVAGFVCGKALTTYLFRLAARDLGKQYEFKRRESILEHLETPPGFTRRLIKIKDGEIVPPPRVGDYVGTSSLPKGYRWETNDELRARIYGRQT